MKKVTRNIKAVGLVLGFSILAWSCAQNGSATNATPQTVVPYYPATGSTGLPAVPSGTSTTSGTAVAPLTASAGALNAMFFSSGAHNPTNIAISMSTYNSGSGYAGTVTISYTDTNDSPSATFSTTHPTYGSTSDAQFNLWVSAPNQQGQIVHGWHGFFQDYYGAIVVVIDSVVGLGDGTNTGLGGSVWFQNFGSSSGAQGPNKMCWDMTVSTLDPYDCRTFLDGSSLPDTSSAMYPNNAGPGRPVYTKLGTFSGMNQLGALGSTSTTN